MDEIDWALMTRYLRGTCAEAEQHDFEEWMNKDARHRRFVQEMQDIWEISALPRVDCPSSADYVASDWKSVRGRMLMDASEEQNESTASLQPHHAIATDRPGTRKIRRARSPFPYSVKIAAFLLVLALGGGLYLSTKDAGRTDELVSATAEREAVTKAGQRGQLTLSDGTRVQLNVLSKLRYPRSFDGSRREVHLSGEAYFEVNSDPARPFIVHANGATIRVRGTSFGVRAYEEEDEVKVVVVEGAVELSVEEPSIGRQERVPLSKDDMGQIIAGRLKEVVGNVDPMRHLSWRQGRLIFEDTPLSSVATELEDWYDLSIRVEDSQLARRTLTASFQNEAPEVVLQVIATALDAKYRRRGPNVTFYLQNED